MDPMVSLSTQYRARTRFWTNPGSREKVLYAPQVAKDGTYVLIENGREDLYASIQSHAESVDIHVILDRYARGDLGALSRVQGVYADVTGMPGSYAEMLNLVISGEAQFNSLPLETRAKFDHSFAKWIAAMDNFPEWQRLMGIEQPTSSLNNIDKASVTAQVPPEEVSSSNES